MNDVEPRLYPTVIREMIRHENDVTNHRIMWLCDLLEPYFFLPSLLIVAWLFVFLHHWRTASTGSLLVLSSVTTLVMLWLLCVVWVGSQRRDENAAANPGR